MCFPTEIPPVENLTVTDQCTIIRASWDITEGSCTDLSYNVTLLSSDAVTLQGPFTTSDTVYNFTDVKTFNGTFNVNVVTINGNVRGANVTEPSNISVSPNGRLYSVYFTQKQFFTENKQLTSCICTYVYREGNIYTYVCGTNIL